MTDFTNDPIILGNMRVCLSFMAEMKGVKLEHRLDEYDMKTMLKMMTEMEDMPIRRSFKRRLRGFGLDATIFGLTTFLQVMRPVVWLAGKVFGGEIGQQCEKFLIEAKEVINKPKHKEM